MEELFRRAVKLGIIVIIVFLAYYVLLNPNARRYYEAGLNYHQLCNYEYAYKCFQKVIRDYPYTQWAFRAQRKLVEFEVYRMKTRQSPGKRKREEFGQNFWDLRKK